MLLSAQQHARGRQVARRLRAVQTSGREALTAFGDTSFEPVNCVGDVSEESTAPIIRAEGSTVGGSTLP